MRMGRGEREFVEPVTWILSLLTNGRSSARSDNRISPPRTSPPAHFPMHSAIAFRNAICATPLSRLACQRSAATRASALQAKRSISFTRSALHENPLVRTRLSCRPDVPRRRGLLPAFAVLPTSTTHISFVELRAYRAFPGNPQHQSVDLAQDQRLLCPGCSADFHKRCPSKA